MTAKDIQRRLIFDLYKRSFVIPNYTPKGWWECDLFELTEAAFFREYEIKISRADFKSDASKSQTRAHWRTNLYANAAELETTDTKHSLLAERSVRGPSNFSFVVPDGLIEPSELPEWAGLIYASASKGNHRPPWNVRLLEVKKHRGCTSKRQTAYGSTPRAFVTTG